MLRGRFRGQRNCAAHSCQGCSFFKIQERMKKRTESWVISTRDRFPGKWSSDPETRMNSLRLEDNAA